MIWPETVVDPQIKQRPRNGFPRFSSPYSPDPNPASNACCPLTCWAASKSSVCPIRFTCAMIDVMVSPGQHGHEGFGTPNFQSRNWNRKGQLAANILQFEGVCVCVCVCVCVGVCVCVTANQRKLFCTRAAKHAE